MTIQEAIEEALTYPHRERLPTNSSFRRIADAAEVLAKEVQRLHEENLLATSCLCQIDSGNPEYQRIAENFLRWQEERHMAPSKEAPDAD